MRSMVAMRDTKLTANNDSQRRPVASKGCAYLSYVSGPTVPKMKLISK